MADRRTPWTDGRLTFSVIPAGDLVRREGELFRLPPALAAQVDALAPAEPAPAPAPRPAASDGGRLPLALLVTAAACLPLVLAAAVGARRRPPVVR